jgi:hypothetical protein
MGRLKLNTRSNEAERSNSRVSSGLNEVKTSVYTIVDDFHTVDAIFLLQIRIKPRLDILHDRLPTISRT